MTHGLVLGKFLPPHAGHRYLIDFARGACDQLSVVVGTLAREPIPGALRARWIRELYPQLGVIHLTDENPQQPGEHPDFWRIWEQSLRRVLPGPVDLVFASEAYGETLAQVLGARFIPVDPAREALPISGTAVRDDPWAHWPRLPAPVRAYYQKRVSIFGPESTGKSTLALALARRYRSLAVPEYARTWIEARGGAIEAADIDRIAMGQIASEEALAAVGGPILLCDTDPLLTVLWSDELFGTIPTWLKGQAIDRPYALTLLLDVDVPWIADVVRYRPERRSDFFARCEALLRAADRPYLVLRGGWDERWRRACDALDDLWRASTRAPLDTDDAQSPSATPPTSGGGASR